MTNIILEWNDFKSDIINTGKTINYTKEYYIIGNSEEYRYKIFSIDNGIIWITFLQIEEEKIDFENNYLASSTYKNYTFKT